MSSGSLKAEGDEQQARLVDVAVVAVDDDDLQFVPALAAEAVGDQGAAGPASQDDDPFAHARNPRPWQRPVHPRKAAAAARWITQRC